MGQDKTRDTQQWHIAMQWHKRYGTWQAKRDTYHGTRHKTLDTLTMTLSRDTFNTVTQEIWDKTRDKTHIMGQERLDTHHTHHDTQQRHIAYSDTWETYCGIHIMGHDKTRDTNYWIWQDTRDTYHGTWQDKRHILWNMTRHETPLRHTYYENWCYKRHILWKMTSKDTHIKGDII